MKSSFSFALISFLQILLHPPIPFLPSFSTHTAHMENVLSRKLTPPHHKATYKKKKNTQPPQQPLKVVYITNPIKFKTTASQFKALVQELTGKNADYSPPESDFRGHQPSDAAIKVVLGVQEEEEEEEEDGVSREEEKMGRPVEGEAGGSNPIEFGSGSDSFYNPLMMEDFHGMVDSNLLDSDILQNLLCENYN